MQKRSVKGTLVALVIVFVSLLVPMTNAFADEPVSPNSLSAIFANSQGLEGDGAQWLQVIMSALQTEDVNYEPTEEELASITILNASSKGITKVYGLDRLVNLAKLDLTNNQLGEFDPVAENLPMSMDRIYLGGNGISTISDNWKLYNITVLSLRNNNISVIPDSISEMPNLINLYLDGNSISVIPDSIANLGTLSELNVANNQISVVPQTLLALDVTFKLNVAKNNILDIPENAKWYFMKNLVSYGQTATTDVVELSANAPVKADMLKPQPVEKTLNYYEINDHTWFTRNFSWTIVNNATGETIVINNSNPAPINLNLAVGDYTATLKTIGTDANNICGHTYTIPVKMIDGAPGETVNDPEDVEQTSGVFKISEQFPDANLAKSVAKHFGLTVDSYVTQEQVAELYILKATSQGISDITGIGALTSLVELDLTNNQLSVVPEEIVNLSNLDRIYLGNNNFTEIPDYIRDLTKLTVFSARDNQLTEIPECLVNLPIIRNIFLQGNQITVIPDYISQVGSLSELNLSYNQISVIPEAMTQVTINHKFSIIGNRVSKLPVDTHWTFMKRMVAYGQTSNTLDSETDDIKTFVAGQVITPYDLKPVMVEKLLNYYEINDHTWNTKRFSWTITNNETGEVIVIDQNNPAPEALVLAEGSYTVVLITSNTNSDNLAGNVYTYPIFVQGA